jgi:hypothetical protein
VEKADFETVFKNDWYFSVAQSRPKFSMKRKFVLSFFEDLLLFKERFILVLYYFHGRRVFFLCVKDVVFGLCIKSVVRFLCIFTKCLLKIF